jgi:hypothetical protein
MDFNNIANMKLSDFENIGKTEYNKGFKAALETVVKLLDTQICDDFKADDACEHTVCSSNSILAEGLMNVKNNIG